MSTNQNDFVIDNGTGFAVRTDIQDALQALAGNSSGNSEPSVKYAYQWWADTGSTPPVMKLRNSNNDGWITIFELDGTITLEDGTVSAPALSARNDPNTGVFFSAADTFNIATGGVERMELGTTTIFNEDGADVDFRIEGDSQANLFYVDAGNDRIGINTSTPAVQFDIVATTPTLRLSQSASNYFEIARSSSDGHYRITTEETGSSIIFKTDDDGSGAANRLIIDRGGKISTGAESSPDCCNGGITIQQNAENGNALSIKSTNVDHGVTDKAETDTYFTIQRASGSRGGAFLEGFTDAQSDDAAFEFMGVINSDTASSSQVFTFRAGEKDGSTGAQNIASNRRIACFKNNDNTRCVSITPHGVTFGDDFEEANALDDYEEGTWTPTFFNITAPTYSTQTGRYTKIGRFVFLTGTISVSSGLDTSDASAIAIGNIPFTADNTHAAAHFTFGHTVTLLPQSHLEEFDNVNMTNTLIALLRGANNLAYSGCNSSGTLQFAISYAT